MRIITLDIGNTNPHAGIFENQQLLEVVPLSKYKYQKDDIRLLSRVNDTIKTEYDFNLKNYFRDQNFFNMKVNYGNTLGIDRLIVGHEVFQQIKKENITQDVLVIDAGTFITCDIINLNGFEGGYILPGIKTFMKIYNEGRELDIFEFKKSELINLPHQTSDAIIDGANFYLKGMLSEVIKKTSPCRIILTGGSSEILLKFLNELNLKIEVQLKSHLIHQGMLNLYLSHLKR